MNRDIVKWLVSLAALVTLSGCSTVPVDSPKPMISAAEFDAMITIEVRELEPLPVDSAVAASQY